MLPTSARDRIIDPARARGWGGLLIAMRKQSHEVVSGTRNQRERGLGSSAMLRVRLLGQLAIELDGTDVEPPSSRRARALLAWVALDRRVHSRSELAARFWPDVLDESARTSLRSALSALRKALGPSGEQYLIAGRDGVGLAGESLVWTDVGEFEQAVAEGRLEEALVLSQGELLAGLDDDWVYERRDEHCFRVADVLARLAADGSRWPLTNSRRSLGAI